MYRNQRACHCRQNWYYWLQVMYSSMALKSGGGIRAHLDPHTAGKWGGQDPNRIAATVLMALVDARYRFTFVDIGSYGRISDGGVFNSCCLSQAMQSKSLNVPAPSSLTQSATESLPYVMVADDAFALQTYILKPYATKQLTYMYEHRIFNYRLSRARRLVENAFGIRYVHSMSRIQQSQTRLKLS